VTRVRCSACDRRAIFCVDVDVDVAVHDHDHGDHDHVHDRLGRDACRVQNPGSV
jgi:hypothetical protein